MAKAGMNQDEYAELKEFLRFYSSHYMQISSLPPESQPIACLEMLENMSMSKARNGLRQVVGDIVESTRHIKIDQLIEIDAALRQNGIVTLSTVRGRYSKDVLKILKRRKIENETEYYLLRWIDAADDFFTEENRRQIDSMIDEFERRSVTSGVNLG